MADSTRRSLAFFAKGSQTGPQGQGPESRQEGDRELRKTSPERRDGACDLLVLRRYFESGLQAKKA